MQELFGHFGVVLASAIFASLGAAIKAFKFVQEGEQGCKMQFGKAMRDEAGNPIIIQPGFVLLIPFVETLRRRHIRQQTLKFERQEIFVQGDLVFIVSAIVRFRVKDIYKALFEVDNLDSCVSDRCMGLLRDILQTQDHDSIRSTEDISQGLLEKMKEMEQEWGVEFLDARLTSCAPSENSAQILSSKTSAKIRAEAAENAAKVLGGTVLELQGLLSAIVGTPVVTNVAFQQAQMRAQQAASPPSDAPGRFQSNSAGSNNHDDE